MASENRAGSGTALWALVLLTATYTFSFIDRQIINLLVDPIRTDLSLSDSQVSFLQGLAFALPYVILSIPLGRIVDRANRIRVLVIGILVWTVSCVTCGLAKNFWQLGVARMGVGAGEAREPVQRGHGRALGLWWKVHCEGHVALARGRRVGEAL